MTDRPDLDESLPALEVCGLPIQRLVPLAEGANNRSFRVETGSQAFVLWIPSSGLAFVDRVQEVEAARLAFELKIGPELIHASADGLLITRWVDNAQSLASAPVRSNSGALERLGHSLAVLHGSARSLARRYDPFEIMNRYLAEIRAARPGVALWSQDVDSALLNLRAALSERSRLVPCHCDLAPANCLDNGRQVLLIDWEYAGMNDPAWDLAYFAVEAELDPAEEALLAWAYGDESMSADRIVPHKLLVSALGVAWSHLPSMQHRWGDLRAWSEARRHCAEVIASRLQAGPFDPA